MHSFGIGCMNRNEVCKVCEPHTTEVVGEGTANFDDERIEYEESNMFARRDPEEPFQG